MKRYIDRPREQPSSSSYAAEYVLGEPLDDLWAVARMMDLSAQLAEVPDLEVLVVRYLEVPDDHPARVEYEVVESGSMLVYSENYHMLLSQYPESFEREHQEA